MATVSPEASTATPDPRDQRAADTGDQHTPTALYRLYDTRGALLYVGVTNNPERRFKQHRDSKPWWPQVARKTVEWRPSRVRALAEEAAAITAETPVYNIDHNPAARQDAVSLHWPPAGMPADRVDTIRQVTEALPLGLAEGIQRSASEAFARAQATAFEALVAEHGLQVEEWDTDTLDKKYRDKFMAFYLEHKDGTRIVVVPIGQDPAERLRAVRALLTHQGVTA